MSDLKFVSTQATVAVNVNDQAAYDDAISRVTGPGGDEWRASLYDLHTENDVLDHWAYNAVVNGVADIVRLDGWADVKPMAVTMNVIDFEVDR